MQKEFQIVVGDSSSAQDRALLEDRLNEYNRQQTGYRDDRDLTCILRHDDGSVAGGISGFTWGGYAWIEVIWLDDDLRGRGLGRRLLEAAEAEARARGCSTVALTTHDFQAPGFYEKLGYELVAELADTPRGHSELFFRKRLDAGGR